MLSHFIYNSLSMTKIESRPIPGQNWKYRFFVDLKEIWKNRQSKMHSEVLKSEAIECTCTWKLRTAGGDLKMTRIKECVLYREFEHGEILDKMTALMDACEKSAVNAREMEEDFYECVNGLIGDRRFLWICGKSVAQLSDTASCK